MSPHSVLEISENASEEEIKKAYKRLSLLHHPDKNGGTPESMEKFKEINNAYDILKKNNFQRQQFINMQAMHEHMFRQMNEQMKNFFVSPRNGTTVVINQGGGIRIQPGASFSFTFTTNQPNN